MAGQLKLPARCVEWKPTPRQHRTDPSKCCPWMCAYLHMSVSFPCFTSYNLFHELLSSRLPKRTAAMGRHPQNPLNNSQKASKSYVKQKGSLEKELFKSTSCKSWDRSFPTRCPNVRLIRAKAARACYSQAENVAEWEFGKDEPLLSLGLATEYHKVPCLSASMKITAPWSSQTIVWQVQQFPKKSLSWQKDTCLPARLRASMPGSKGLATVLQINALVISTTAKSLPPAVQCPQKKSVQFLPCTMARWLGLPDMALASTQCKVSSDSVNSQQPAETQTVSTPLPERVAYHQWLQGSIGVNVLHASTK